ncbi:MAG: hypothetical protein IJF71_03265, partial [Clostridia bacterium]|nr:hypothetical protein [Clostridia bacterium]
MQKDAMVTYLLRDYAAPIRIVGTVKQNKGKLFLSLPQGLNADTVALTDGSKVHRYTVDREKSLEITVTGLDSVTVFLFHGGTPVAYASREPLSASERKRLVAFINNEPTRKEQDDSAI